MLNHQQAASAFGSLDLLYLRRVEFRSDSHTRLRPYHAYIRTPQKDRLVIQKPTSNLLTEFSVFVTFIYRQKNLLLSNVILVVQLINCA